MYTYPSPRATLPLPCNRTAKVIYREYYTIVLPPLSLSLEIYGKTGFT